MWPIGSDPDVFIWKSGTQKWSNMAIKRDEHDESIEIELYCIATQQPKISQKHTWTSGNDAKKHHLYHPSKTFRCFIFGDANVAFFEKTGRAFRMKCFALVTLQLLCVFLIKVQPLTPPSPNGGFHAVGLATLWHIIGAFFQKWMGFSWIFHVISWRLFSLDSQVGKPEDRPHSCIWDEFCWPPGRFPVCFFCGETSVLSPFVPARWSWTTTVLGTRSLTTVSWPTRHRRCAAIWARKVGPCHWNHWNLRMWCLTLWHSPFVWNETDFLRGKGNELEHMFPRHNLVTRRRCRCCRWVMCQLSSPARYSFTHRAWERWYALQQLESEKSCWKMLEGDFLGEHALAVTYLRLKEHMPAPRAHRNPMLPL